MKKIYSIFIIILLIFVCHRIYDNFENSNQKKVAVCFFGLCRSTQYTVDSIKKNIYSALDNLNVDYDVYLHTYKIDKEYNNIWAGEINQTINNNNYKLLNPKYVLIEDDENITKQLDFVKYRTHGDPWGRNDDNKYTILNNAIKGMYSIYQVTNMWKKSNINYDIIICLRPDVLYLNPITMDYLNQINDNVIVIPDFAEYPINDRFAMGNPSVMERYGNRYLEAHEYSKVKGLHTETYLNDYLNKYNINIIKINFKFCRISITGENRDPELL